MTLAEIAVTLVLLAILALLVAVGSSATVENQKDLEVRNRLNAVVSAQHVRHDTLGSFATSNSDLDNLVPGVDLESASTPADDDGVYSIDVTAIGGEDVVLVAGLGRSGRCYAVRSFEPGSDVPDRREIFDVAPNGCTAAAAAAVQDGIPW